MSFLLIMVTIAIRITGLSAKPPSPLHDIVKNVLFYEVPTTQNFLPSVFVDIENTIDGKVTALLAHESQVAKTNIEGLSIVDAARSTAVFRGIQGRVHLAEGLCRLDYL